jgi:replication-associated recombination protein RarA
VFLGSPGTGKTTVARLFGKILKAFKLLSDGDFIETSPSDLKGVAGTYHYTSIIYYHSFIHYYYNNNHK